MKLNENMQKISEIISKYGKEHQSMVAIEEMSELTKELSKDYRGKLNKDNLTEELADVILMCEQIKLMYEIKDEDLKKIIKEKIDRVLG